jgi:mercuric ion binding protein
MWHDRLAPRYQGYSVALCHSADHRGDDRMVVSIVDLRNLSMSRIAIALALLLVGSSAFAAEQTVRMHVESMTCAACPIAIRTAMERDPGVKGVKVDLEDKTATVVFHDAEATVDQIAPGLALGWLPNKRPGVSA